MLRARTGVVAQMAMRNTLNRYWKSAEVAPVGIAGTKTFDARLFLVP